MVSDINWVEMRKEYENSDIMLKDLALKNGISPGTVRSRKNREGWQRNEEDIKKNVATQRNSKKNVATSKEEPAAKSTQEILEQIDGDFTDKQLMFIQEYPIDLNGKKAAIRAGYSPKTAAKTACLLLANPKIEEALHQVMAERAKRLQITADRVLEEYAKIGFADIKDFLSFETKEVLAGHDEKGNPVLDYKTIVELKPSGQVEGRVISEVSISRDGTLKFKLHDKKGALDMIGKHLGMFIDKHEHTGKDGGPIEFTNAKEKLLGRIDSLAARRREAESTQHLN